MDHQAEVWRILNDLENRQVWDNVYKKFHFSPSNNQEVTPFVFNTPVDVYDISNSNIWYDDEDINKMIRSCLVECMGDDPYMYALDWQHTCFRYNPRIIDRHEYPVFVKYDVPIKNGHVNWEGESVYFPPFYPDGDYYFFISMDFSCGYLTHPWQKNAYVFGEHMRAFFRKNADAIGFALCAE